MASSPLETALGDGPWAVSALLHGLSDMLDDEGRPLGERRANSVAKEGVPIELHRCPYADERHGQPMNLSALTQITRHLDACLDDVRAFRGSLGGGDGAWGPFMETVIDQLGGPARHVLLSRGAASLPAWLAVGHKLAAGYFGVARALLVAEAQGERHEVSVEGLRAYIHDTGALLGASEVCAGPPPMLTRVSQVLLHGTSERRVPPERVVFSRLLSAQITLGVAWELFDEATERALLLDDLAGGVLRPRTTVCQRTLDERLAHHARAPRPAALAHAAAAVPGALGAEDRERIRAAMLAGGQGSPRHAEATEALLGLLDHGEGAVELGDDKARRAAARRLAGYLLVHREVVDALHTIERSLRACVGFSPAAPVELNGVIFPLPRARLWLNLLLGHQLRAAPQGSALVLANHRRSVVVCPG